jgi:hypothetical protein
MPSLWCDSYAEDACGCSRLVVLLGTVCTGFLAACMQQIAWQSLTTLTGPCLQSVLTRQPLGRYMRA